MQCRFAKNTETLCPTQYIQHCYQLFSSLRPTNNTERTNKCTDIVEIPNNKEVILLERTHDKYSKKFKFDNVFGPSSKQVHYHKYTNQIFKASNTLLHNS